MFCCSAPPLPAFDLRIMPFWKAAKCGAAHGQEPPAASTICSAVASTAAGVVAHGVSCAADARHRRPSLYPDQRSSSSRCQRCRCGCSTASHAGAAGKLCRRCLCNMLVARFYRAYMAAEGPVAAAAVSSFFNRHYYLNPRRCGTCAVPEYWGAATLKRPGQEYSN